MNARPRCLDEEMALSYLGGEVPLERRSEIEAHLDECGACRRLLDFLTPLESVEAGQPRSEQAPSEDRYAVLGEHARGGQARILIAFDEKVGREVALKELLRKAEDPSGEAGRREATERFLREARLTSQMAHPGVVPVFDIGERPDGTPFYTMQLVSGRTLSEVLRERRRMEDRLALLSHFLSICHVIAYAHSRGIVHRDLKPQNIMLGEFGETIVLDWGLAKQKGELVEMASLSLLPDVAAVENATQDGTIVGTPGYMSPEQASGSLEQVDERSDVYGLGAVLLEILAGKPPPPELASSGSASKSEASGASIVSARSLCQGAPPELVAVTEKALAFEKRDRYQHVSELAQEITAFMTGGRVAAHSYTRWDLVRRFSARHRVILSGIAVAFAAILAALLLTSVAWHSELISRRAAQASESVAALRGRDAQQEGAKLALAAGDKLQARAKLRGALELGDSLTARALWRRLRVDPERFAIDFASAVMTVSFAPDSRELAVGLQSGIVHLIDPITRASRILRGGDDQISTVAFSPDGRFLASGALSGSIVLWDLAHSTSVIHGARGSPYKGLALSPDGETLAAAEPEGGTLLLDTRTGAISTRLSTGKVKTVAFSADRRRLAAGGQDAKVVLWDLETRTSLFAFPGLVERIAFTPGGEILVGGGFDGSIYLWNAATGELLQTLRGHEARVSSIRVRPDGKLLASSSADGTVRLWDLPGRRSTLVLNKANVPMDTAFSPDGSLLAAAAGNTVWVWELSVPAEPDHPIPPSKGLTAARFNPEGSRIASVGEDGLVRQWDSASGELLAAWSGHVSGGRDLCYTPDGKLLASGGFDGVLVIRDAESGAIRHQLSFGDRIWAVACAPDGWHVASGGLDGRVRIWDALSGELVRLFAPPPPLDRINSLIFNPSGRQLVVGRNCGHVEIWDTASEKRVRLLLGHTAQVYGLAVDATGKNARVGWGRSKRASLEPGRRIKPTNR